MPPEEFVLFLETNLAAKRLRAALQEAGVAFELHLDHFPEDTPDPKWIAEIGVKGWVIITTDQAIRRRAVELRAVHDSNAAFFVLDHKNLNGEGKMNAVIKALPKIRDLVESESRPFLARISRNGDAYLWLRTEEIRDSLTHKGG